MRFLIYESLSASSMKRASWRMVDATKSKDFRSEGLALPPEEIWQQVKKNLDNYFVG